MAEPAKMTGIACQYRGKDREHPTTICLTPDGRRFLDEDARRLGKSRADHVEHLIRKEHARLGRQDEKSEVAAGAR